MESSAPCSVIAFQYRNATWLLFQLIPHIFRETTMTDSTYISDRERGARARVNETISLTVWQGLYSHIKGRIEDGSFGEVFPETCLDGPVIIGTNETAFWQAAHAEIPNLPEVTRDELPDTYAVLDLLQFCAQKVAAPKQLDYHENHTHHHLTFDQEAGREEFVGTVNQIFTRNGIVFNLTDDGVMQRLGQPDIQDYVMSALFRTGDDETNELLEDARKRFLSPRLPERKDAVKKLWYAFERVKTLEFPENKKKSTQLLLDRCVTSETPIFRECLESESRALTDIGNDLCIRHAEKDREPLGDEKQIDYLYYRLFNFLLFLLRKTDRIG